MVNKVKEQREQLKGQIKVNVGEVSSKLVSKLKRCFLKEVPDARDLIGKGLIRLTNGNDKPHPEWTLTMDGLAVMFAYHYRFWETYRKTISIRGK